MVREEDAGDGQLTNRRSGRKMRRKIDITRCHRKIYRCHMRGTATGGG
jgi:hypothetical protein